MHNAKESAGEKLHNMQEGLTHLKDAGIEKLAAAKEKLKYFIGTKKEAEENGTNIDNEYIVRGYRINHNTCSKACTSIATCHNETINVWSHLSGSVFFFLMTCSLFLFVAPLQFGFSK